MLNDLLAHLLIPTGARRRARRLAKHGEEAIGVVDGIRVRRRSEAVDIWEWAVVVGAERLGVRQNLVPQRERAHLGAELVLRRDGSEAIIDWPATLARAGSAAAGSGPALHGWKALSDVPRPGIEDDGVRQPQGQITSVVIESARPSGGMLEGWALHLLDGDQRIELGREVVPGWAVHLLVPGTSLPAYRQGDRVAIDWVVAAESHRAGPTGFDFDAHLPGADAAADESDLDLDAFNAEFDKWKPPPADR